MYTGTTIIYKPSTNNRETHQTFLNNHIYKPSNPEKYFKGLCEILQALVFFTFYINILDLLEILNSINTIIYFGIYDNFIHNN